MIKKSIYILVFVIIFNFISYDLSTSGSEIPLCKESIVYADGGNNVAKVFYSSLVSNCGFSFKDALDLNHQFVEFLKSIPNEIYEFNQAAKEFVIRQMFQTKESTDKLIREKIIKEDNPFMDTYNHFMQLVYKDLNRKYFEVASNDKITGQYNYGDLCIDVLSVDTINIPFDGDFFYTQDIDYRGRYECLRYENLDYYHSNLESMDLIDDDLLFIYDTDQFNGNYFSDTVRLRFHDKQLFLRKYYDPSVEHDVHVISDTTTYEFTKKDFGFQFRDYFPMTVFQIHLYYSNSGVVQDDLYIDMISTYNFYTEKLDDVFTDSVFLDKLSTFFKNNLNRTEHSTHGSSLNKIVNNNFTYNNSYPKITQYVDNRNIYNITNNNITYNVYGADEDLKENLNNLIDAYNENTQFFEDYFDYLNGKIDNLSENISFVLDSNNRIAIANKEILNQIDKTKVDYSKIDDIVSKNISQFTSIYFDKLNNRLNSIDSNLSKMNSNIENISDRDIKHYETIRNDIKNLSNEISSLKNNSSSDTVKDYKEDFNTLEKKLDDMKNDYNSRFNDLDDSIKKLSVSNIDFDDNEKSKLKSDIVDSLDFFGKLKNFFINFFTTDEKIDIKKIDSTNLSKKIPFCVFHDLANIVKQLYVLPKIPKFSFKLITVPITIDFADFETFAKIIRSFSFLFFIIFIIIKFYDKVG